MSILASRFLPAGPACLSGMPESFAAQKGWPQVLDFMQAIYSEVADQLLQLEAELRLMALWQEEMPPAEALASSEPFCVDTLTLPQWLQFIFLPRMRQLVEGEMPLPQRCGIAPIAEEYFKNRGGAEPLVVILKGIDERLQRG
ncbi:YqcC family protein [Microbulbifer echini]|uniref:YqcC family protein n=1 Tax=Microbulbifer echini TaxID=1529067 RepID=A0ABV4NQG8_9GAMM